MLIFLTVLVSFTTSGFLFFIFREICKNNSKCKSFSEFLIVFFGILAGNIFFLFFD